MAEYTIRLNLGGDIIQRLKQANKLVSDLNKKTGKGGGSFTGNGVTGGSDSGRSIDTSWNNYPFIPRRARGGLNRAFLASRQLGPLSSRISNEKFLQRFNESFRQIDRFKNEFVRNSFSITGLRRNVGNFIGAINSTTSALSGAVPAIGALKGTLLAYGASQIIPAAIGGIGYSASSKLLNSRNVVEATGDRLQLEAAQRGLGNQYVSALRSAETIAAQYGIGRSSAVSNLNILSGLQTASGQISLSRAEEITRAAAIIGSFGSAPFERVAQNLQQILSVSTPNARDIRELLHQAPIIAKYATQEDIRQQRDAGVLNPVAGDPREFLKDSRNLFAALDRLLEEFRVPRSAEIRGQQQLRRRDLFIQIEDEFAPLWEIVGKTNTKLYNVLENAVDNFVENIDFGKVEYLFTLFVDTVESLSKALPGAINGLAGIGNFFSQTGAALNAFGHLFSPLIPKDYRDTLAEERARIERGDYRSNLQVFIDEFNDKLNAPALRQNENYIKGNIFPEFLEWRIPQIINQFRDSIATTNPDFLRNQGDFDRVVDELTGLVTKQIAPNIDWREYSERFGKIYDTRRMAGNIPDNFTPGWGVLENAGDDSVAGVVVRYLHDLLNPTNPVITGSTGLTADTRKIEDLTRGSKSLYINFNAPLVESQNTFNTSADPQQISDILEPQLIDHISRALYIAINNSTRSI